MRAIVSPLDSTEPLGLEAAETRLIATFSPPLRPEDVRRCLLEAAAEFRDAPVRTYLPVLIERAARIRLERCDQGHDGRPDPARDPGDPT